MKTEEIVLFKNLRNELKANQGGHCQRLDLSQPEVLSCFLSDKGGSVIPDEYQKFQEYIHDIDTFKKGVTSPEILDDLVGVLKTGSTIEVCQNYFGEINQQWNKWAFCCTDLDTAAMSVSKSNVNILRHMDNAILALDNLIKNPQDSEAKISLDTNINYIKMDDLQNIYSYSESAIEGASVFQKSFEEQKKSYDKIITRLSEEATLQDTEKQKIKHRIDQLNNDISSYNATIAAISLGMGVSVSLFFISVKVSGMFSFVVGLLLIPAVTGMMMALSDVIAKIKIAQKEIADYGDYKSKYDGIILRLSGIKSDVEKTQKESAKIKDLISNVISPWTSLRKDLDELVKYISDTKDYKKARDQFEEGKNLWSQISANAEYLKMPSNAKVVLNEIPLDTSVEKMMEIVTTSEGITMGEYLRQRTA